MMGEVEESAVIAMPPRTVAIPIRHYGAHVIVKHFAGHPAEEVEGALVAAEQRRQPFIGKAFEDLAHLADQPGLVHADEAAE
jgi:hypothetical protein